MPFFNLVAYKGGKAYAVVGYGMGILYLPQNYQAPANNGGGICWAYEEESLLYLAIFSSSRSRGSTARLLSYISATSPAACILLSM